MFLIRRSKIIRPVSVTEDHLLVVTLVHSITGIWKMQGVFSDIRYLYSFAAFIKSSRLEAEAAALSLIHILLSGLGRACRPRLLRLRASRLLPGKAGYGSPHHKYNKHNEDQSRQGKQQIPGVPSLVSPSYGFIQAGHIIFMLEHGASSSPHCKSRNLL